jgi:hypothetical protein
MNRPAWLWSRDDRLDHLIGQAESIRDYLIASLIDTPRHTLAHDRYAARLAIANARLACLYRARRSDRGKARHTAPALA